jgi:hypothetical protein
MTIQAILRQDQRRLDLHNPSIDFAAAIAGQCGFTHLDSGRVCRLPHRHHGPCDLRHDIAQRGPGPS